MTTEEVQLPASAVADEGDVAAPTTAFLRELKLLGTDDDIKDSRGLNGLIHGSPDSVAVIEASATAFSKWWAAGLGAAVVGAWPAVGKFWSGEPEPTQRVVLIGLAIGIAAAVLAIGYIVGSDVRGRSAAA